jgi:hypothetical protein
MDRPRVHFLGAQRRNSHQPQAIGALSWKVCRFAMSPQTTPGHTYIHIYKIRR